MKSYPVLEEWTEKKVKRTWYTIGKEAQVDSIKAPIKELEGRVPFKVEESNHNLGCLPIVELRNKQQFVYELQSPYSCKPQLATWYPVRGMIKFAYHTLRQIWKNMILVKPKIIGEIYGQDMQRMVNNSEEMSDVLGDMFIALKHGTTGSKSGKLLEILQGDMKIKEWFEGVKSQLELIDIHIGFPSQNEAQVERTATEVRAKDEGATDIIRLLRQLRIDQALRIHDKALIIKGLWNGKGKRPYTLSLPEEETLSETQRIEESKMKIETNMSNYIAEIAKLNKISAHEARNYYTLLRKINW